MSQQDPFGDPPSPQPESEYVFDGERIVLKGKALDSPPPKPEDLRATTILKVDPASPSPDTNRLFESHLKASIMLNTGKEPSTPPKLPPLPSLPSFEDITAPRPAAEPKAETEPKEAAQHPRQLVFDDDLYHRLIKLSRNLNIPPLMLARRLLLRGIKEQESLYRDE